MPRKSPIEESRRTDVVILFCLMELKLSGYTLCQLLTDWNIREFVAISDATVYRALVRLEKNGYISKRKFKRGEYPESRIYCILDKGRKRYGQLVKEGGAFIRGAYPVILLGMGSYLSPEKRRSIARTWQSEAKDVEQALLARLEDKTMRTYGKPFAEWLLLDHEISILRAEIAWLDRYLSLQNI
ncbi:MAG: helix-turn-helix transcriptional regulator [Verrucomicrobia bacterium]|nr:helix-turn-helix transcriptional regulator [Verrucomicrobiota bacterium]